MSTRTRLRAASLVFVSVLLAAAVPAGAQVGLNQLKKIDASQDGGQSVLTIRGTTIPNFTSFKLSDPFRLVVDFSESEFAGARGIQVGDGLVDRVEVSQHGSGTGAISRVVITMTRNAAHQFRLEGNDLVVQLAGSEKGPPQGERLVAAAASTGGAPEPAAVASSQAEESGDPPGSAVFREGVPSSSQGALGSYSGLSAAGLTGQNPGGEAYSGPKSLEWIGFEQLNSISRIFLRTSEIPDYRVTVPDETTVVVELPNTRISTRNNLRFLDTSAFDSVIDMITPFEEGSRVAVEIRLRAGSKYRDFREGRFVVVDFPRPSSSVE